jgi:hypothetical protein
MPHYTTSSKENVSLSLVREMESCILSRLEMENLPHYSTVRVDSKGSRDSQLQTSHSPGLYGHDSCRLDATKSPKITHCTALHAGIHKDNGACMAMVLLLIHPYVPMNDPLTLPLVVTFCSLLERWCSVV